MLIINAEFTAGIAIEDAIREAVEFSDRMGCMVKVQINDIPMTIVSGLPNPDRPGCRMGTDESVKYYNWVYKNELNSERIKPLAEPLTESK